MRCPKCGEESFPRKKVRTEGWKVVEETSVCALCGAPWERKGDKTSASGASADPGAASRDRLAALLGGETVAKVTLAGSGDCRFCRSCRHFMQHPFKCVCALSDREIDPMGSCGKFTGR